MNLARQFIHLESGDRHIQLRRSIVAGFGKLVKVEVGVALAAVLGRQRPENFIERCHLGGAVLSERAPQAVFLGKACVAGA